MNDACSKSANSKIGAGKAFAKKKGLKSPSIHVTSCFRRLHWLSFEVLLVQAIMFHLIKQCS
jgi:hypothetical protein